MEYAQLIIVAILVEAIWENLRKIRENGEWSVNRCGALLLSILICLLANVDIFPIVGISISIPFVGAGLTGIIVSRGANFVNDLFTKLNQKGEK